MKLRINYLKIKELLPDNKEWAELIKDNLEQFVELEGDLVLEHCECDCCKHQFTVEENLKTYKI